MNSIFSCAKKQLAVSIALFFIGVFSVCAQTHVSVPIGHEVYYILEQAETRGLCAPLPAVKPYTRARIAAAINEILSAEPGRFGGLSTAERNILEDMRGEFSGGGVAGLDLWNGTYRFDIEGKQGVNFSGDFGISLESLNSGAYYMEDEKTYLGTDTWGTLSFKGDIGEHFSFNVDFSAGLMRAQRVELGTFDTFGPELGYPSPAPDSDQNRRLPTMSHPLAFFPYTYQKKWDGFMFGPSPSSMSAGGMEKWPEKYNIAAAMRSEMSASILGDMLLLRFGRLQREWGAMSEGSSLVYNAAARPFVGIEASFNPVPWFAFSSITGVLEFDNAESNKSWNFQNAYSLQQLEFNYQNYFHIDFGSSVIWAKRFELGYLFPLLDNFFYQNFIGDFDNMGVYMNLRGQYPGLGKIWFSLFMDEVEIASMGQIFELDRHMFAYQAGLQVIIPKLPFASFTASYTKIEPYNYTHYRIWMPWYEREKGPMEIAYVNNGVSIGHYLPPNADEIKLRFDICPMLSTSSHMQYQLIRHGADFGPQQVDGSSLLSEKDSAGKPSMRKNFLNDGAYQWMHIIKAGASYKFKDLPLTVFGETGCVYSYFTTVSDAQYEKYYPSGAPYDNRDTLNPPIRGEYNTSTTFILTLGFKVFR